MGSVPSCNQSFLKQFGSNYASNGYYRFKQSNVSRDKLQINALDIEIISKIISSHCLLSILPIQKRSSIVKYFTKYIYEQGVYIYRQHDISTNLYLIKNGSVSVQIYCNIAKTLSEENYFGHQSFCFNYPRGQSIRILTQNTILYILQKDKVFPLIYEQMMIYREDINSSFNRIHFFNYLNNKQRNFLIQNTFIFTLNSEETLFEKQQDSNSFYIVRKGQVTISIDKKKDIIMKENDYFGESAFLSIIQSTKRRQRMGRAYSNQQKTEVYAIGLNKVKNCIGNQIRSIVFFNLQKWALYRDQHLNSLPNVDYNHLLQLFNVKEGKKFNILAKKGSIPQYLYIPLDLQINFSIDPKLYCSEYLKKQNQFKPLNHDILMTDEGCYAYALIKQFKQVLSLKQNASKSHGFDLKLLSQPIYKNLTLTLRNVSKYSKKIPSSQYSHVLIVQDMKFGNQFLVKIYKKQKNKQKDNKSYESCQIISENKMIKTSLNSFKNIQNKTAVKPHHKNELASINYLVENSIKSQKKLEKRVIDQSIIRREKSLLASLNSKFFCGYFKAQHDQNNYYLFLEYIVGISLHQLIIQFGIVPHNIVKYIIASIATAIDYLHSQKIVYRNLNSSDIIMSQKGNIVITDFSCARRLGNEGKTNTIVGIPYYMAPEMINNTEYTYTVDIWSLGIVFYELLTCTVPFGEGATSPIQIYQQIVAKEVNFGKVSNKNAKTLLRSLLQKDPSKRLAKSMGIRQFNFINDSQFDWSLFLADELSPIFFSRKTVFDYVNINNFDFFDASTIQDWN